MFSQKGYGHTVHMPVLGDVKTTLNLNYIDVPLNVKVYYGFGLVKMYAQAGPYLGIGITGKSTITAGSGSTQTTTTTDVKWGSDSANDDFKRFDGGLSFGLGAEMMKIQLGLTYNLGLLSISPSSTNGLVAQNRVLAVSVGYKF